MKLSTLEKNNKANKAEIMGLFYPQNLSKHQNHKNTRNFKIAIAAQFG